MDGNHHFVYLGLCVVGAVYVLDPLGLASKTAVHEQHTKT
jgi:hypothetical protein